MLLFPGASRRTTERPAHHSAKDRWEVLMSHIDPSTGYNKYLNNVVEVDHGKLKQLIRPVWGFKTLKAAYATIMGFEVMRALRKGQAAMFNLTQDICGEARIVERAFGIGASAIEEVVALISEQVNLQPA